MEKIIKEFLEQSKRVFTVYSCYDPQEGIIDEDMEEILKEFLEFLEKKKYEKCKTEYK